MIFSLVFFDSSVTSNSSYLVVEEDFFDALTDILAAGYINVDLEPEAREIAQAVNGENYFIKEDQVIAQAVGI